MNIKEERDLFRDHWFEENLSSDNEAYDSAWLAWLASRNREGYVLVPIEPTEDVLLLMCDEVCADFKDMENAYKAMIGACDDRV